MYGLGIQGSAGQVLQDSFDYVNNFVVSSGLGTDINSYMYSLDFVNSHL